MIESTPNAATLAFRVVEIGQAFEVERSFTAEDVQRLAAVSGDWSPLQTAYAFLKVAGRSSVVNILSQVTADVPPARMADSVVANTVSPGLARIELTEHSHERVFKMEAARIPLGRLAALADVANTVTFLLGDESAFLTGVNLRVSCGQVMS